MDSDRGIRTIVLCSIFKYLLESRKSRIEDEELLRILDTCEVAPCHIQSDDRFICEDSIGIADSDDLILFSFDAQDDFKDSPPKRIRLVFDYIKALPNGGTRPIGLSLIEPDFGATPYVAQLILIGRLRLTSRGVMLEDDPDYLIALGDAQRDYWRRNPISLKDEILNTRPHSTQWIECEKLRLKLNENRSGQRMRRHGLVGSSDADD